MDKNKKKKREGHTEDSTHQAFLILQKGLYRLMIFFTLTGLIRLFVYIYI